MVSLTLASFYNVRNGGMRYIVYTLVFTTRRPSDRPSFTPSLSVRNDTGDKFYCPEAPEKKRESKRRCLFSSFFFFFTLSSRSLRRRKSSFVLLWWAADWAGSLSMCPSVLSLLLHVVLCCPFYFDGGRRDVDQVGYILTAEQLLTRSSSRACHKNIQNDSL